MSSNVLSSFKNDQALITVPVADKKWNYVNLTTRRKITIIIIISFTLSILFLVGILKILISDEINQESNQSAINIKEHVAYRSHVICFTCSNFSNFGVNVVKIYVSSSAVSGFCCVNNTEGIATLSQLILNERNRNGVGRIVKTDSQEVDQEEEPADTRNNVTTPNDHTQKAAQPPMPRKGSLKSAQPVLLWQRGKNAAHVYLNTSAMTLDQSYINASIPWTCSPSCKVSSNQGIKYDDSIRGFKIRKTAMYYVYSAVAFRTPSAKSQPKKQLTHSVRKWNFNGFKTGEQLLMINKYDENKQSRGYFSSFLSGTLTLQNGDALFVRVSNTSLVYDYYYTSFFGLYEVESNVGIQHQQSTFQRTSGVLT